jgi:Tfp pilus assembly protein PilP
MKTPAFLLVLLVSIPSQINAADNLFESADQPVKKAQSPSSKLTLSEDSTSGVPLTLENSMILRDPFREPEIQSLGFEEKEPSDLEEMTLSSMTVIGIITGTKKTKALIKVPSGRVHIVSESMSIGPRKGKVKKITESYVLIEERVLNILGHEEKILTRLILGKNPMDTQKRLASAQGTRTVEGYRPPTQNFAPAFQPNFGQPFQPGSQQGVPSQGFQPQGFMPQGFPSQGFPPQGNRQFPTGGR